MEKVMKVHKKRYKKGIISRGIFIQGEQGGLMYVPIFLSRGWSVPSTTRRKYVPSISDPFYVCPERGGNDKTSPLISQLGLNKYHSPTLLLTSSFYSTFFLLLLLFQDHCKKPDTPTLWTKEYAECVNNEKRGKGRGQTSYSCKLAILFQIQ